MGETLALTGEILEPQRQLGQGPQDRHQPASGVQPFSDGKAYQHQWIRFDQHGRYREHSVCDLKHLYVRTAPIQQDENAIGDAAENGDACENASRSA